MKKTTLKELLQCIEAAVLGRPFSSSNKELNDAHWAMTRYGSFDNTDILEDFGIVHEYLIEPFLGLDYKINFRPKWSWIELYKFELGSGPSHPAHDKLFKAVMPVLDDMSLQDISCPASLQIDGLDTSSPTMWRALVGRLWEIKHEVISDFANFVKSDEYKSIAAEFWGKVEEQTNYLRKNPRKIYYARGAGGGGGSVYEEWSSIAQTVAANKAGYVRTSSDEGDIGISYATKYYLTHPSLVKGEIRQRSTRVPSIYPEIKLEEA